MNRHLSREQVSRCMIGDGTVQESRHARECFACGSELARLEASFGQFRACVRHWSDQVSAADSPMPWQGSAALRSLTGLYSGHGTIAGVSSVLVHAAALALLLLVGSLPPVQQAAKEFVPIFAPDLRILQPKPEQSKGGGGSPQELAETKGQLPKVAPKSFVPPIQTVQDPKLAVTPTIVAPDLPNIQANSYGDPLGKLGIPSTGNGIGSGVGVGKGPGVGPGNGGGFGGGAFRIGGGVSAPVPIFKPEPEYSEEARKLKWQGSVVLSLVVDENGIPQNIKVIHSLGLGLDQKAIEAVQKWRFKPGLKDGKAVPVFADIEVNFRLL